MNSKSPKAAGVEVIDSAFLTQMFERSDDDREKLTKVITDQVAAEFQIKPADLRSNSRKQSIVMARGIAIYLSRKLLGTSFVKIGSSFGNRDHSTIMHANRKIETLLSLAREEPNGNPAAVAASKKVEKLERNLTDRFASQLNFT